MPVERTSLHRSYSAIHKPDVKKNGGRITKRLEALVAALEKRELSIRQEAGGVDSEDILVLETACPISDFYKTIRRISGFEWLMEEEIEGAPDEDFFIPNEDGEATDKALDSRLYLVSTNAQALNRLYSLYKSYVKNPDMVFLPGYASLKHVFELLRDIRFWNYQDRLDGVNLFEDWLQTNAAFPDCKLKFQIELWFRGDQTKRATAQARVENIVRAAGGEVLTCCIIPEIRYHALLVEMPRGGIQSIVENLEEGSLIKCNEIMYFKSLPQAISSTADVSDLIAFDGACENALTCREPVVALFDGYPLEHHKFLEGRLVIDDPDDIVSRYTSDRRVHGTEMASLIIHGDLSCHESPIDCPLYLRPIMVPAERDGEQVMDDVLAVDLIHRAVRRMFEGENGIAPTAPSVKIINFSIGDPVRMFHRVMSPMARLLDWLSYKYSVLFIISAGNSSQSYPLDCSCSEFKAKGQDEISKYITKSLLDNRLDNRMISPSESINNITVGSVHQDHSNLKDEMSVNPYDVLHPAIYSRFGGGFRNAVKPDLVYDGGRQMLVDNLRNPGGLKPSTYKRKPGIQVAYPDTNRDKTLYDRGTSFSTALITRHSFFCYKVLHELLSANGLPETHIHLLVKALAVHGCSWDEIYDNIKSFLPASYTSKRRINDLIRKWIGYGYPDFEKSLLCNKQRVTVVGFGDLIGGKAHIYDLPLPQAFQGKKILRRLTVTLAWMSPIVAQNQKYRNAKMWFEVIANSGIAENRIDITQYQSVRLGTLQHEVFEEDKRFPYGDDAVLRIKVNCADDAGPFDESIKYAIAVTLEVGKGVQLGLFDNIYEEISEKLSPRVPIITNAN